MKNAMQKWISVITIPCLLTAVLTGCGSKAVTEVTQTPVFSQQGTPNGAKEVPQPADIPEEDVQTLIRAGLDAVEEESGLWEISDITDTGIMMQLMQGQGGRRERPKGGNFDGERPENMTPPDGEFAERPDGEMPDGSMPEWDGNNSPKNAFPEGEMPEGGQDRGEGGSRQPGNRGGRISDLAIVISGTEDTTLATEKIFAQIQLAAGELGLKASSMKLTEEQQSVIEVPDGYSVKMVVLISVQIPEMDAGEAVG